MREAVIAGAVRTAVGKAPRGTLSGMRPEDLAAVTVAESIKRLSGLDINRIDDVVWGCAFPEGEQGMNLGRIVALRAGIPAEVPGFTVNRFCASGLQAVAIAAQGVISGSAQVVIAGGVESMSTVPIGGYKLAPNPWLMEHWPEVYLNMGLTAENVAREFHITREAMDSFALESHQKASKAIVEGKFIQEIVPVQVVQYSFENNRNRTSTTLFQIDEGVRPDGSLEALAGLRPAFHAKGTVTAGNSSQMSDGAAALVIMSRALARELDIKPLGVVRSFAVGGVNPEMMGIGPIVAIPRAVQLAGITIEDLDLIELNEAFASQVLAVINELGLDPAKVNVNGGAIALGHPLGCTGAKLTVTLLHEMARRGSRYGLVSMCIAGGMGAAAVFEKM